MKTFSMLLGAVLVTVAASAVAGGGKMRDPKAMDTNGDGMISKDEFMKHHEMMWGQMKKNSAGMVDMKEMGNMYGKMMHDTMKPEDKAAKDKAK